MERKPKGYWTFERCKEEALKYKSRGDFQKGSRGCYKSAMRNGWLNEICEHTNELNRKPPNYWAFEKCKEEALKYNNRTVFARNSQSAYSAAQINGWLDEICQHIEDKRKPFGYWTKETCIEASLECSTPNEFKIKYNRAYDLSCQNGWIDEIYSNFDSDRKHRNYWTKEKCKEEALKYSSKTDYATSSSSSYVIARVNDWLDEICDHMSPQTSTSKPEQDLFDIVQESYKEAKKLVDRKANIPGKPHIKGFDVDIYIPSLKKGIEFDGKYYHSFKGLRRGRPNWSDEDIRNYHQIKDDYFKSQGIEIIHIKESDWIDNQEEQLNKIWEFLKE